MNYEKNKIKIIFFTIIFFGLFGWAESSRAATYYVDQTGGNDGNAGTSAGAAWKTAGKVSGTTFAAGDNILFKRGETWAESITAQDGTERSPITYGAYGTGDNPIIHGASDIKDGGWSDNTGNVWSKSLSSRTGIVYGLWYNTTNWGVKQDNTATINSIGEWYYNSGTETIYVYATSIPSTYYSALWVDSETAAIGLYFYNQAGKVVVDGIAFKYFAKPQAGSAAVVSNSGGFMDVKNCTFDYYNIGIGLVGASYSGSNLIDNNVFTNGYYGAPGRYAIWTNKANTTISYNNINALAPVGGSSITNGNGIMIYEGNGAGYEVPTGGVITLNTIVNTGDIGFAGAGGTGIAGQDYSTAAVGGTDIDLEISYNTVTGGLHPTNIGDYDGIATGGYAESLSAAWKNIRIHHNTIEGYGNSGIEFANYSGAESSAYYNVIDNCGGHGWGGILNTGGASIYNNVIHNVYQIVEGDWGGGIWAVVTDNAIIKNNIIDSVLFNGITVESGKVAIVSNNLISNVQYGVPCLRCTNTNGITSDPLFSNANGGDFRLQASSPAINAGTNVGLTTDFLGNPIVGLPDIGAYEYTSGDTTPPAAPSGLTVQ